jgi:hypothetical protein
MLSLINKFEKLIYNEPKEIFENDILLVAKFCYEFIRYIYLINFFINTAFFTIRFCELKYV